MQTEEIEYMNIAKGLGMCLIVLGHSFEETSLSSIRSFVYLFHVPLFFIISGYFFRDIYITQPTKLLINRIKSIWGPFFRWTLLFILLHNFFFSLYIYSEKAMFRNYSVPYYNYFDIFEKIIMAFLFKEPEQLLGAFWFLSCLFFTTIIYLLINIIIKHFNLNKLILTLLVIILFIFGNLMFSLNIGVPFIPWDFRLFCITLLLFHIGKIYKNFEQKIPIKLFLAISALIILLFINKINYIKIDSIYSTFGLSVKPVLYLIFTPVLGSYFIFYVSKIIAETPLKYLFRYIGKNTITILALHFLSFKIVSLLQIHLYDLDYFNLSQVPVIPDSGFWFLAYFSVGIAAPLIVNLLLKIVFIRTVILFK
jgi:fucose 4-O-acetylase-like acetyltransferase